MDFDSTASYRLVYSVTRNPGLTKRASRNPFTPLAQLDRLPDAPRHAVARNMPAARAVGAPSAVCVLHDQGNDEPLLPKLRHTAGYLVRGKTGEGRHLLRRRHPKAAVLVELAAQRNHYRPMLADYYEARGWTAEDDPIDAKFQELRL